MQGPSLVPAPALGGPGEPAAARHPRRPGPGLRGTAGRRGGGGGHGRLQLGLRPGASRRRLLRWDCDDGLLGEAEQSRESTVTRKVPNKLLHTHTHSHTPKSYPGDPGELRRCPKVVQRVAPTSSKRWPWSRDSAQSRPTLATWASFWPIWANFGQASTKFAPCGRGISKTSNVDLGVPSPNLDQSGPTLTQS